MEFAPVIDGLGRIPKEQKKCPTRCRDVNRMKMLVERQNRQRQRVLATDRVKLGNFVVDLERLVEIPKRIFRFQQLGYLSPWHASECSNK